MIPEARQPALLVVVRVKTYPLKRGLSTGFRFLCTMSTQLDSDEVSLLESFAAFLSEHRGCGELDGGAEEEWIWMACSCGAVVQSSAGARKSPLVHSATFPPALLTELPFD